MTGTRHVLAFVTDDVLAWWLNGTFDESMREWWTTPDAIDTATELVHVMFQSLNDHGWEIVPVNRAP
jgi:hypothetical protein